MTHIRTPMKLVSKSRIVLFVTVSLAASYGLSSCVNSTSVNGGGAPIESEGPGTFTCVGHLADWSDGGGITTNFPVTATWERNTSSATLHAIIRQDSGSGVWQDSVHLELGAKGWQYASGDGRASWEFAPTVKETSDSVTVSMSSGFVINTYLLRKQ